MASSEKTQNLQLNKWLGNDSPKREDFNYDNEKIDQAIKQTSEKIGILSDLETSRKDSLVGAINEVKSSSDAKNVSLDSPNFTSSNVQDGMNELFTNVSNGKITIASAIIDMGQSASGSDTFSQLGSKVKDISKDANASVGDVLNGKTFYQGGVKRIGTMPNRGNATYTPNDSIQTGGVGYYSGITVNPRPNLTGNATTAQVLNGQTFYSNSYTKQTGVMPNRGTVNQTITTQNGSYTIPQGYHSGSGKVAATFNNLTAGNVKKGVNIGGVVGTYEEGGSIKSIQRGKAYTRERKMNITISSVNVDNSIVKIYPIGDYYNDGTIFAKTAILKDSTTIEIESYSSYYSHPYDFTYEVIEFKKAKSKQSGLLELNIAAIAPLSRVNPAKCLVSFSNRASSSSNNYSIDFFIGFTLSAESLRFHDGSKSESKQYVAWEVLEFD